MPENLHHIPIAAIDEAALTRDRTGLDAEALAELRLSIAAHGLRMPIEVFELAEPRGALSHGLLSGFRRLTAVRALHELTGEARWETIPAFLRAPADLGAALTAMVEENEVRAELSPFERGRIIVAARDQGVFGTIEEAVERLYPAASPQKRARLRTLARLAEEIEGHLTAPEFLTQAQALRLAAAFRAGFGEAIRTALAEASLSDPASQWQALLPILAEAERAPRDDVAPARPGRPRRVLSPRPGLTIRREMTRDGWLLRFTGREATGPLLDAVMDEIERMFGPG
jgi:ParB family transcriptional regulator, chromosome partitioning protein